MKTLYAVYLSFGERVEKEEIEEKLYMKKKRTSVRSLEIEEDN